VLPDTQHRLVAELAREDGGLDRPVAALEWQAPAWVRADGPFLLWQPGSHAPLVAPRKGMLEAFLALGDAPPQRIAAFASRWGVLGICEHDLPCSHNPPPIGAYNGPVYWCSPLGWYADDRQPYEPIATWRAFAREAFGVTRIAHRLMLGQVGEAEQWAIVYGRSGRRAPWWKPSVEGEKLIVARVLNEWLRLGSVRPVMEWRPSRKHERPAIRFGGSSGLFGALALQLALAIGKLDGLALCVHCRAEYMPAARSPKAGQRNFCPDCRKAGIPNRYSLRDWRERNRRTTGHGKKKTCETRSG